MCILQHQQVMTWQPACRCVPAAVWDSVVQEHAELATTLGLFMQPVTTLALATSHFSTRYGAASFTSGVGPNSSDIASAKGHSRIADEPLLVLKDPILFGTSREVRSWSRMDSFGDDNARFEESAGSKPSPSCPRSSCRGRSTRHSAREP